MKSRRWVWLAGIIVVAAAALLMVWMPFRTGDPILTAEAAEEMILGQYPGGKIEENKLNNGFYEMQLRSDTGLYHVVLDSQSGKVKSIRQVEAAAEPTKKKTLQSREKVKNELQRSTDGKVVKLELVEQQGKQVYEAVIQNKDGKRQEVIVDPYTAEIISTRTIKPKPQPPANKGNDDKTGKTGNGEKDGNDGNDRNDRNDSKKPKLLTESEASKLALAKFPGEVEDIELRGTDGGESPYYLIEIELKDGREATVEINAITRTFGPVIWDDNEKDDGSDQDDDG